MIISKHNLQKMILWNTTVDINNDLLTPVNYIQWHCVILCNMYHKCWNWTPTGRFERKTNKCQLEVNYQNIFQYKNRNSMRKVIFFSKNFVHERWVITHFPMMTTLSVENVSNNSFSQDSKIIATQFELFNSLAQKSQIINTKCE